MGGWRNERGRHARVLVPASGRVTEEVLLFAQVPGNGQVLDLGPVGGVLRKCGGSAGGKVGSKLGVNLLPRF